MIEGVDRSELSQTRTREIVDAAAHLFASRGYAETGMREIAAQAGVGLGAMYYHVPGGKLELLARIQAASVDPIIDDIRHILTSTSDAAERLYATGELIMTYLHEYRDYVSVFLAESRRIRGTKYEDTLSNRGEVENLISRIITEGVNDGTLREQNARLSTLAFLGMLNFAYVWYDPAGPMSHTDIACYFVEIFVDGVKSA